MALQQICKLSGRPFFISDREVQYCTEHDIPLPTLRPIERLRRMTSFDNGIYLYNGVCALSGQSILTSVPPDLAHPVYSPDIYASDQWDPLQYGREYDGSQSFFDQIAALYQQVPLPARWVTLSTLENCEYVNGVTAAKNCYLIVNCTTCEDCLFGRMLNGCKNVVDSICVQMSELCYGCINVQNSYHLMFGENCSNCQDSWFLFNCKNLKHCYGCSNLTGKEYFFENIPCTPEEYEAKLRAKNLGSYQSFSQELATFHAAKNATTRKFIQGYQCENCTGNYINQAHHCQDGFFVLDAVDVVCGIRVVKARDVYAAAFAVNNAEQIYACHGAANNAYNLKWCLSCANNIHDLEYCIHTSFGSHDCFGCVGLRQKEYCILNKQYTKDEYFDLVNKIRTNMKRLGEYGELFPASMSPQYYNESYAMEFAPLSRDEALKQGYHWKDEPTQTLAAVSPIPDHIVDVTDAILDQVLVCSQTGKKYRITTQELNFYRRFTLPIPRIAPLVRLERLSRIVEMKDMVERNCSRCDTVLPSVYREEAVLCESCYQNSLL